jgi:hypothetical protein
MVLCDLRVLCVVFVVLRLVVPGACCCPLVYVVIIGKCPGVCGGASSEQGWLQCTVCVLLYTTSAWCRKRQALHCFCCFPDGSWVDCVRNSDCAMYAD